MLTNDEVQRVARLVRLAPYMDQEQREGLLDLIRKLKAADAAGAMPTSAVQSMVDAIDDKTMRAIVEEQRHRPEPGWIKKPGPGPGEFGAKEKPEPSEPVKRKPEDRTRQFAMFDAIVEHLVGGSNDCSKLK